MLSNDIRSRIADLKRSALRNRVLPTTGQVYDAVSADDADAVGVYELPPPSYVPKATASDARIRLCLDDVASGSVAHTPPGSFYLIDQDVASIVPRRGHELERRFRALLDRLHGCETVAHDPFETFGALSSSPPESLLFVDIEATGFTPGTPLFLVGLITAGEEGLRVRQLLARDYTEEGALLYYMWKLMHDVRTVVSFNGKTYDVPYIRDRMTYYGYRVTEAAAHIDLLHEGRRRFKDRLVNCKLQTLERAICGRGRIEDIPGADIPEAYHAFVRTGNAVEMRDILHHNALDLVTMDEIVLFMLEGREL